VSGNPSHHRHIDAQVLGMPATPAFSKIVPARGGCVMIKQLISSTTFAAAVILVLISSTAVMAEGGKNAYNNPTGDPPEDTYLTPYANFGGGRTMIFCDEDEKLVITPVDVGSVEASCIPVPE
jgi:hypothetical protein